MNQAASNDVTGWMCKTTGECRPSCSEGGGAPREGVEQSGQSSRGMEGTGQAKEGGDAEGTRQGQRRGQKAEGCHTPCAQRQKGPGHVEERVPCTLLCNMRVRGRVRTEASTGKHRAGKGRERERERGCRQKSGVACIMRVVALTGTDENRGSPRCGLMQVESQRLGAAGQRARPDGGNLADRRKNMVQCRATCEGRSGTEGEQREKTGRAGRQARESNQCRVEAATEGRVPGRASGEQRSRREEEEGRERGIQLAAQGFV